MLNEILSYNRGQIIVDKTQLEKDCFLLDYDTELKLEMKTDSSILLNNRIYKLSDHDYYHTIRVYKLATKIAKQENADVKIVQLAALLHDVDDIKLSPDTYVTKKNAVDFMTINKIDGKRIEAVCKIIDEVSFAGTDSVVPDTIEGKCVQDADRLDAIGAIGIARTFAYGGSRGRKIYDPEIKSKMGMNKEEYRNNQDSTSINHFYEKLLLLKDMMNTTEGKKLEEYRQVVMQEFLNEFMLEWEGKM